MDFHNPASSPRSSVAFWARQSAPGRNPCTASATFRASAPGYRCSELLTGFLGARGRRGHWPRLTLEQPQQGIGNEARSRRINMPVAARLLSMHEESLRYDQVQIVFCARHGDVEQAPFFLELGGRAGAQIGRHAAVNDVKDEYRLPFLPLGGMDGRQDQIVLVAQRHAGTDRSSHPADRASARSESARGTDSPLRSAQAAAGRPAEPRVLVDPFQMRLVPDDAPARYRPGHSRVAQICERLGESGPILASAGLARECCKCRYRISRSGGRDRECVEPTQVQCLAAGEEREIRQPDRAGFRRSSAWQANP